MSEGAFAANRQWARRAAWIGAALFGCALLIGAGEALGAGRCAQAFMTIRFELAGFDSVMHLLTGPCGAERARALHWVLVADAVLFVPLYVAFLSLTARAIIGSWGAPALWLACVIVAAAGLADWFETFMQWRLTDWVLAHRGWDFAPMQASVEHIVRAAQVKFILLCGYGAVLALVCFLNRPQWLRITGALQALPAGGAAAAFQDADERSWMLLAAFAIAWGALLLLMFRRAREKDAPPSSQTPQDVPRPWRDGTSANRAPDT